MESNDENQIKFKINPRFNFLYEMGMPTGRKIKSSLIVCIIFIVAYIILCNNKESLEYGDKILFLNLNMFDILKWISIIAIVLTLIRAVICTIVQYLSYEHTSYIFYEKYMVYEDDFLNQHKKTIQYENVKEVEIRRTIWDRILGYGVIVIYTNAENNRKNGLVIYSIRNVREIYEKIESLVRSVQQKKDQNITKVDNVDNVKNSDKKDENFIENMTKQVKD